MAEKNKPSCDFSFSDTMAWVLVVFGLVSALISDRLVLFIGASISAAIFGFLVHFFWYRKIPFFRIFAILSLVSFIYLTYQQQQKTAFRHEMLKRFIQAEHISTLRDILNNARNESNDVYNQFNKILDIADEEILTHEKMSDPIKAKQIEDNHLKAAALIEGLPNELEMILKKAQRQIQESSLDRNNKNRALSIFNKTSDKKLSMFREFINVEVKLLRLTANMVSYLRARQGRFEINDSGASFYRHADLEGYNSLAAEMEKLSKLEAGLTGAMVKYEQEASEELNDLLYTIPKHPHTP